VESENNGRLQNKIKKFAITGLGLVSPLGSGVQKNWQRLTGGESAVRYEIKNEAFIARAEGFDMSENLRRLAMAFIAVQEAIKDAGLINSGYEKNRIGLSCGESKPDLFQENFTFDNSLPEQIKNIFKIEGQTSCVSAACATGTLTIIKGCELITNDICDAVICGVSETSVHPLYIAAFKNMGVLSKKGHKPFDKDRDGFSIGEGAGFIIVEDLKKAVLRGAKIYCELAGKSFGIYTDNMVNISSPDGMRGIIRKASGGEIPDYIHAHGTGTKLNDYFESAAIGRHSEELRLKSEDKDNGAENAVIPSPLAGGSPRNNEDESGAGARCERPGSEEKRGEGQGEGSAVISALQSPLSARPLVSSTKAATGHMLGVSGIVGSIFSILALKNNIVPPTLNFNETDIPFNLNYVKNAASAQTINSALSLSFGFGGHGAALCFKKSGLC
jgi:3-oxoacyl-[acyl-carrier-protein] synthase II